MAELRRNQRGEIGRQHVKAHSCSHFSPCFDHTHHAHPDQRRHKSDRPWHRSLRPLLLSNNVTGSFTSPSNWSTEGWRRQGHRPWTEKGVSQLAWSHQFFTDLGWWSGRGLNSRPPGQQTGALATELTGRHWKCFLGPVYMEVGDTISHFNLITLYMIGGVTRHMLPHLSTGHGVFHLQVNRPLGYPEYSWISKNKFISVRSGQLASSRNYKGFRVIFPNVLYAIERFQKWAFFSIPFPSHFRIRKF